MTNPPFHPSLDHFLHRFVDTWNDQFLRLNHPQQIDITLHPDGPLARLLALRALNATLDAMGEPDLHILAH